MHFFSTMEFFHLFFKQWIFWNNRFLTMAEMEKIISLSLYGWNYQTEYVVIPIGRYLEKWSKSGNFRLCKELFKIIKLRSLDISVNKLSILSPELAKLVNLKMLNLSHNRLRQIDQNIFAKMTKLETLIGQSNLFVQTVRR